MTCTATNPHDPMTSRGLVTARRAKTGGRKKGTPNKTTLAVKEAIAQVYAALQAEAGQEHGHLLDWARDNPTHFYRLMSRLLPRPKPAPPEDPDPITEVRHTIVYPDGRIRDLTRNPPAPVE